MSLLLAIETALEACSVAIGSDGKVIAFRERKGVNVHATQLTVLIGEVLEEAGMKATDLDAVSVSRGPGSYTGLRIGAAAAKGLCFAIDKPLIAVDTLKIMAKKALQTALSGALLCPMIDARRMEVYYALYDGRLNQVKETVPEVVAEDFLSEMLQRNKVIFFGNGMPKCRDLLSANANAFFMDAIAPSADAQIALAEEKFRAQDFEDIIRFEPLYLKNFVPGNSTTGDRNQ